ncbi:MAG: type IV secretion system DNA-binding domain-containing protein [Candidatus Paracaedibacter sp.]
MILKSTIRGGKLTFHNINMLKQVFGVTLLLTILAGGAFWSSKMWFSYTPYERYILASYYWADFKLIFPGKKERVTQYYRDEDGRQQIVRAIDITQNKVIRSFAKDFENRSEKTTQLTLWFMSSFFFLAFGGWFWRGYVQKQKKLLNGLKVIPWRKAGRALRKFGKHTINLGRLPFPQAFENEHTLFVGRTGSGKTNAINDLVSQITAKKIIIDSTGGYVARFYNPNTDKLLNPFDDRSEYWNLWQECNENYDFMEFAESLIPPEKRGDQFWVKAAQQMLATAAEELKKEGNTNIESLLELLLQKPLGEAVEEFRNTNVATYFDPDSGRMAHSIRAILIAALWSLKYLEASEDYFSIKQWVQDPKQTGTLFICCDQPQRNTMRPLMTAWLSIAIKSLMALPEDITRRVWFIMDELASLNNVPCLLDVLQEGRKYGSCILIGLQNYTQVRKIYGPEDCDTIFDLIGTRIALQSFGSSAQQISKYFGKQEILEANESLSYGENSFRDGLSLTENKVIKDIVSETDLGVLNPFESYIKYPRNIPIVKMEFLLKPFPQVYPKFVKKIDQVYEPEQLETLKILSNEIYDMDKFLIDDREKNKDKMNLEI